MAVNQAISQLAQFRSEMELVIAEMRRMRGEMGVTKSTVGFSGSQSGGFAWGGGQDTNVLVDQHLDPGVSGFGGENINQAWATADWVNYGLTPSKGAEDQMYKQMTRRRWVAMAGQINALVSVVGRGMGGDSETTQAITGGVSNIISTVSWIFTAKALLAYAPGPAMVFIGSLLIAQSWIDYLKNLNDTDPIYKMGGPDKAHIINGQVMYN